MVVPVGSKLDEDEELPVLSGPAVDEELYELVTVMAVVPTVGAVPPVPIGPEEEVELA